MLFVLRSQHFGAFAVEAQDQDTGLPRPFVDGVLADAINKAQAALFELSLQFLLPLFVLFRSQRLAERVPGRYERGALSVLFGDQKRKFGAGLDEVHLVTRVSVDEVFGLHESLEEFGGVVVMHDDCFFLSAI